MSAQRILYRAEPADGLVIEPLDFMTLVYQRRSGLTHMVAEPVPEILAVMAGDTLDAQAVLDRLSAHFDLDTGAGQCASIAARLEELADLGLLRRVTAHV